MATLSVRHTVADYAAWRRIFDDLAPTQEALCVTDKAIYEAADNAGRTAQRVRSEWMGSSWIRPGWDTWRPEGYLCGRTIPQAGTSARHGAGSSRRGR